MAAKVLQVKLSDIEGEESAYYFLCPGCQRNHRIIQRFEGSAGWQFNGSLEFPTFRPSVLIQGVKDEENDLTPTACHFVITDGWIRFLDDSTHELAGRVMLMETVDSPGNELIRFDNGHLWPY